MADRIIKMRKLLRQKLADAGSIRNWDHVVNQIGMFCYSGITPDQVESMRIDKHIYMTKDGRISIAGVTSKNVDYLAQSLHEVTK